MNEVIRKFVGKKVVVKLGGLNVEVKIKDVKNSYGRDRYLITPTAGSGEVWVENIIEELNQ